MNSSIIPTISQYADNIKFETGIGPMTDKILNSIFDRITTDGFREKLMDKIVDPITGIINEKIRPYIYLIIIMYIILVILLITIIYLLVKKFNR
ncbi:hypothetical protein H012_gp603 [Acanthamoeba polyphaga moumouvirus]|uniref:Uncharacterized protein n=2 Tax=Moumouvirus TaxID=3080801 RepID=L7RG00_9VIRU|nr:hypothetical protein H012_gp603 [Acanthamoeba polyphaga moumouvirus]AEX62915.1 hypothetical protein mv_L710 [Moumouvirus Monve]AGC01860.1 hypothetical protein Moumou_00320 [Acanthamoeba polyphaga moumouvirus]AQN68219.1 hypothetical protein [Saudi moumouvirus]